MRFWPQEHWIPSSRPPSAGLWYLPAPGNWKSSFLWLYQPKCRQRKEGRGSTFWASKLKYWTHFLTNFSIMVLRLYWIPEHFPPIHYGLDNNSWGVLSRYLAAGTFPIHLYVLFLYLSPLWGRDYYHLHIKDRETEVQHGEITCKRSHSGDRARIWTQIVWF